MLDIEVDIQIEEPLSEREILLAEIWAAVLKIDVRSIGRHTSFFALGGDSISAVRLATQCTKVGLHILTHTVFRKSTLAMMALSLEMNDTRASLKALEIE